MLEVVIEKKSMINLVRVKIYVILLPQRVLSTTTKGASTLDFREGEVARDSTLHRADLEDAQHLLRGEGGVYYEDLYPLISFLPRFNTATETATEEDMLPLWKASGMDHEAHRTIRRETLARMKHQAASEPPPKRSDESDEKEPRSSPTSIPSTHRTRRVFDPEQALPDVLSEHTLRPSHDPPTSSLSAYFPLVFSPKAHFRTRGRSPRRWRAAARSRAGRSAPGPPTRTCRWRSRSRSARTTRGSCARGCSTPRLRPR